MPYRVENIGAQFNAKGVSALADMMNTIEQEGWKFQFAFPITNATGCLGLTKQQSTLAVFHRDRSLAARRSAVGWAIGPRDRRGLCRWVPQRAGVRRAPESDRPADGCDLDHDGEAIGCQ